MAWSFKDGKVFNTTTGVTKQRDRADASSGGIQRNRRGHEKTTGTMRAHRLAKRDQAEVRNEFTPPERTKQYRLDAEYRAEVDKKRTEEATEE